jgi:hypothetical protein
MAGKQTFRPSKLKSKQDIEREALRLAIWILSILHRNGMLHLENRVFGDGFSTVEGIGELLKPLLTHSRVLREVEFLFDPCRGLERYTDPRVVRAEIRRLKKYSKSLMIRYRK